MDARERTARLRQADGVLVAPSLLSCDFARIRDEVRAVERAGADLLHLDVMDGHFVPNITIGPAVVAAVRRITELPLDVHLMISNPADYAEPFIRAGADVLTFHIEALPEPAGLIERIRRHGCLAGLVLRPATPAQAVAAYVSAIDWLLVMSVEPGFSGQTFQQSALPKIADCRRLMGDGALLEVDGGIDRRTAAAAIRAGARVLVAGTAIFSRPDYGQAIAALRSAAETEDISVP